MTIHKMNVGDIVCDGLREEIFGLVYYGGYVVSR